MVENPASTVGSDIANRALDADASVERVADLAKRGMGDPSALNPDDVRAVCAALVSHLDKANAAG